MFSEAASGQGWPTHISSDNDPLFQYRRWKANLRVLNVEELKSLPHVPMSHPFVERLIGSVRRELLDHTFFWTATDLEKSLASINVITTYIRLILGGVAPLQQTPPIARPRSSPYKKGAPSGAPFLYGGGDSLGRDCLQTIP